MFSLDHLHIEGGREKKCVINNWVYVETQKNVMYFPYCDVIFFLDCYSLFNNTSNLVHMKNILQKNKTLNLIKISPTAMYLDFMVAPRAVHILYSSHLHHHVPNCARIDFSGDKSSSYVTTTPFHTIN